jgi:hypothetical protein
MGHGPRRTAAHGSAQRDGVIPYRADHSARGKVPRKWSLTNRNNTVYSFFKCKLKRSKSQGNRM